MNICVLLAAGNGTRITTSSIPKQFIKVKGKPLFIYSLKQFVECNEINRIIVVTNKEWISKAKIYIKKYIKTNKEIFVIEGGKYRNESLKMAAHFISTTFNDMDNSDIILTHDAARPFIDQEIILNNIKACSTDSIVTTCIPCVDSMAYVDSKSNINILDRNKLINVQTPQSIQYYMFKDTFTKTIIDTSELISLFEYNKSKYQIKIIKGSPDNFKITNDIDLISASKLISKLSKEKSEKI